MSTPPQPLPHILEAEEIMPRMESIISEYRRCRDTLARDITPSSATFETVLRPILLTSNCIWTDLAVIACLGYASPDKATRDAVREAQRKFSAVWGEMIARDDIFQLFKAVSDKAENLDVESEKLVHVMLRDFEAAGHGTLSETQRDEYRRRRDEIDELRRKINENIRSDESGLWFRPDQLAGLKEHHLAQFAEGKEPPHLGQRFVTFNRADYSVVIKFAENPETRETIYTARRNRLPENVPIFNRVIQLRDLNARLLGYKSHAAFRLKRRMAGSTEWVDDLMENLKAGLLPLVSKDAGRLHAYKRSFLTSRSPRTDLGNPEEFLPWDFSFYTRLLHEQEYGVDVEAVSEYFPLQHVVDTMLKLFTSCLGLVFRKMPRQEVAQHIWHPDIDVFSVWEEAGLGQGVEDKTGAFVGYLYTDLLFRDGKYRGNQNVNLQCGFERPDGSRAFPATVLMCSFSPPPTIECPLLKHHEVVTLFHELGHGIHDLVSKTKYTRFHSYNATLDFGEAPSMFLENFCWLKDELRDMSCHYTKLDPRYLSSWQQKHPGCPEPAEKIPDDMLDNIIAARFLNRASTVADNLSTAIFDLKIHNPPSHQALLELDVAACYNDLEEELSCIKNPQVDKRGHYHVLFGHLVSGYDAGYYSYVWGEMFATDVFATAFSKDPRNRETWERYRRIILEPGGSRDELGIVREFLGRPVNTAALL
ncbi:hypothetical protein QBC47DRAFT_315112, partial [Echria macrotheca]